MIDYENKKIAVEWNVDDVQDVINGMRSNNKRFVPALTEEEKFRVLVYCEENHNAAYGISWDSITDALHRLYGDREKRCAYVYDINETIEDWERNLKTRFVPALTEEEKQRAVDYFDEHDDGKKFFWDGIEEALDTLYGDREVEGK